MKNKSLILVVDEHGQNATYIANFLENKGYKTLEANSGKDGVKIAKEKKPNLIIADLSLYDIEVFEFAKALSEIKILFMGKNHISEAKIANIKNSIGIIPKPVDIEKILEILKEEKI